MAEMINKVHIGNCLYVMKKMEANSVDSIVTDPPYGLSDKKSSQRINDFIQRSFNIIFPNFKELDIKRIKYFDFLRILKESSFLGGEEVVNCIKSFISMPESSIDFNGDILIRDKEINTSTVSTSSNIPNSVLVDKGNAERGKYIGNYVFDFGDSIDFSRGDVLSRNFGEFSAGLFSVPISSILSSVFPHSLSDGDLSLVGNGINDIVGLADDSFGKTPTPTFVLASGGTENGLMLRFNLTNTPNERFATITTSEIDTISKFACPKLIRTFSTTGSLATKLEPCTVSLIANSANGANSLYYFHLYIPINFITNIQRLANTGKGFMGKKWDYDVPSVEIWQECLRVLKPGGFLLSFAGTRTYHRMTVNIEDAGFEIRDMIAWIYATGFSKSHNISKAIDKTLGVKGKKGKLRTDGQGKSDTLSNRDKGATGVGNYDGKNQTYYETLATSPEAKQWDGWGTALKPAVENICVARKPLSEKTVAANVLKRGTGGINIDGCRVGSEYIKTQGGDKFKGENIYGRYNTCKESLHQGRFPANLIHDGSEEVEALFPHTKSGKANIGDGSGSASRFFYCAKASRQDRNEGLDGFEVKQTTGGGGGIGDYKDDVNSMSGKYGSEKAPSKNNHPTVKPTKLIRYLVRLVTPPKGTVLDPFAGSGSTGKACVLENFNYILIELEKDSCLIAEARIKYVQQNKTTAVKKQIDIFKNEVK